MSIGNVAIRPPRLVMINLVTSEELEAWANPAQLTETRSAQWNRLAVPGLGYQPLQYAGTTNRQLADVELAFDRRWAPDADLDVARRFLDMLVAPATTEVASAPPRLLLVWPKLLSLEVVAESVELTHEYIASDGTPLAMRAKLTFEAIAEPRSLEGAR